MLTGLKESKDKLILTDLILESILNLSFPMVKSLLEDGADLKLMALDLDLVLLSFLAIYLLKMVSKAM